MGKASLVSIIHIKYDIFQMVEQPQQSQPQQAHENPGTTFGKLKQTLSSSLLTAQDKGETLTYIFENDYYVTNLRSV